MMVSILFVCFFVAFAFFVLNKKDSYTNNKNSLLLYHENNGSNNYKSTNVNNNKCSIVLSPIPEDTNFSFSHETFILLSSDDSSEN